MKFNANLTDAIVLKEIGARLAKTRLAKNMTQAELANRSGLAIRTIRRLESGEVAAQLSAFIRVCRILNLLDRLEDFLPEATPSPIAQMKLRGRQRQRASGGNATSAPRHPGQTPWTWGERT